MKQNETINEFLKRHGDNPSVARDFNVYQFDKFHQSRDLPPNRRDYYKISLICETEGVLSYADKEIHVKDNAISFGNPMIPYRWKCLSENPKGYFCLFTEDFVNSQLKTESLLESSLFKVNGNPVLFPNQETMNFLVSIFERMLSEIQSPYPNKYELLRNYVQIILHESLKIDPPKDYYNVTSSSYRITDLFLQLLERQFPITSPEHTIHIKNANEFAEQLAIHTNHLNKLVKEITGKTTSEHINERLLKEAKALLLHSNWHIAEIAYCLGFEHPSNFNIFFKKQTGLTPNHFRKQAFPNHNN